MAAPLDYDHMFLLDAECLAEVGLQAAYTTVLPELARLVPSPVALEERTDSDALRYAVVAAGTEFLICAPELDDAEGRSWGRATWALFKIINDQLGNSPVQFYAINSGNELGGMFLTEQQVQDARASLARRVDWPYLPESEHPWYGQPH